MSSILLPNRWSGQPRQPTRLDWSNPILRDLVFSYDPIFGGPSNQVGGKAGEALGTGVAHGIGRFGRELTFSGTQASRACSFGNTFGRLDNATQATWAFLVKFNEVAAAPHFFGDWDFSPNWLIQRNGTGLIWVAADDASGNRRRWDASSLFSAAGYYLVILSWQGGANFTAWVNGVDKSAAFSAYSAAATQMGTTGANNYIQFGTVSGGTALNGSLVFSRIWKRGLSAAECKGLSANPWLVFATPPSRMFFDAGAGGGALSAAASGGAVAGGTAAPAVQVGLAGIGVAVAGGAATAAAAVPLAAAGVSQAGAGRRRWPP